jgi:hypothetical protein
MADQTLPTPAHVRPAHLRLVRARPSREPFVAAVQTAEGDRWRLVDLAESFRQLRDAGALPEIGYPAVTALLGELMGIANDLDVALSEVHA